MMKNMCTSFLEYLRLEKKRREEGLSTFAHRRWSSLRKNLDPKLVHSVEPREGDPAIFDACFKTPWQFQRACMSNISGGGLFVDTEYPAELGTMIKLRIRVEKPKFEIVLIGEVVSQNVSNEYSTSHLGMGIRFCTMDEEMCRRLALLLIEARREKKEALVQSAKVRTGGIAAPRRVSV